MSLLKQLLVSVSVAILGILLGTLLFNVDATRHALIEQLQLQSDNAASSLSLSLSQPANQDPVTRDLLMSALFDTGQFQSIHLTGPSGASLFAREMEVSGTSSLMSTAPAWFQKMIDLPQAQAQRALSNGWSQLGELAVTVDNRFAIDALWALCMRMVLLVLGAGLAWAIFVGSLLRWFRKVLREEVASQVLSIGTAADEAAASQVQELKVVSTAIHDANLRVKKTEKAQLQRIDSLELETNRDVVTGLPNRKFFLHELNKALHSGEAVQGHVLLVRQRDLQSMNTSLQRREVDAWLKNMGELVLQLLQQDTVTGAQFARLNGSDFALILSSEQALASMHVVQEVRKLLQSLTVSLADGQWSRWAFVLTAFSAGDEVSDVLARLDQGLMQAESAGHDEVQYAELKHGTQQSGMVGEAQWQAVLTTALERQQLSLQVKPWSSASLVATDVRHEAALQLKDAQGNLLAADLFLPAAARLGVSGNFDLQAIHLGLQWLAEHREETLVVRVSLPSLEHAQFLEEVRALLQSKAQQPFMADLLPNLVLELGAFALEAEPVAAANFVRRVTESGAGVGLRSLEQAPKALQELAKLPVRYVKIAGGFAQQAMDNPGALYLLEAMIHTANAQSARIYVTDFVSPQAADWLRVKGASLPVVSS